MDQSPDDRQPSPGRSLYQSLLGRIYLTAGLGVFLFIALWTVIAVIWLNFEAYRSLDIEADQQSQELSSALAPILWRLDEKSIQAILDTKTRNPEFSSITVKDTSIGQVWLSPSEAIAPSAPFVVRKSIIEYNGKKIAQLTLVLNLGPRSGQTSRMVSTLVISQILLFMAVLASIALAWRKVRRRLKTMVQTLDRFSSEDEEAHMEVQPRDELGRLAEGFNAMAGRILRYNRTMELEIRKRTQQLMESEKLALVGSLVVGVAHEINTPIGNSITLGNWLRTRTRETREAMVSGKVPEADLEGFFSDLESGLEILQNGLDRTSALIQTFKKIGSDQVADERRQFKLGQTIMEVVEGLKPNLMTQAVRILTREVSPVETENHPGALFQILSNLVLNAHTHGYPGTRGGTILISWGRLAALPDRFWIEVKDDGAGMPPEVLSRIFQPFYTTNRKEGSTGLGLSIVQSLVKSLGGIITVESMPGQGSTFRVELPLKAPDQVHQADSISFRQSGREGDSPASL